MTAYGSIGEQGVALVTAELLARDFRPYRPVVDDHGVDIMLSDGKRIQVKSANLSALWNRNKKTGISGPTDQMAYQFSLQKTVIGTNSKLRECGVTYIQRDVSSEADFLVLVGLNERRFWIVPAGCIADCRHITISQGTSQTKNGPRFKFWKTVRDGEGRWDLLQDKAPLSEQEGIADVDISALRENSDDAIASFAGSIN